MTHYQKTESGILVPFAPHITKRNYIEGEVSNRATMEGLYQLTVRRPDGSIKRQTQWFKNLILDQGLNRLGNGSGSSTNGSICEVGTNSAAPAVGQTSLIGFAARTSTVQTNSTAGRPSSPYYYTHTKTYRFAAGALNGNYTEVGIGWANDTLFSRALITPDGVNPEAFQVLIDEQLDVSYQLRVYPPSESDWGAGTYNISGTNYDIFGRLANASTQQASGPLDTSAGPLVASNFQFTAYTGTVGPITGAPSGTNLSGTGVAPNWAAYSNNSYTRRATQTFGLGLGNGGSIRSILAVTNMLYSTQYQFTPALPKDSTKTLSLTFEITWGRRP